MLNPKVGEYFIDSNGLKGIIDIVEHYSRRTLYRVKFPNNKGDVYYEWFDASSIYKKNDFDIRS